MSRMALAAAAVAVFLASGLWATVANNPHGDRAVITTQDGKKHVFNVEIADTLQKAERGLMFRVSMPADHGMLFEFERTQAVAFWMKDTLIPLDIIFVQKDGHIATIIPEAEPRSLTPRPSRVPVAAAIEINGGLAEKLGIRPGDTVAHPFFAKK